MHLECFLRIVFDISGNTLKTIVVSNTQQPSCQAFAHLQGFYGTLSIIVVQYNSLPNGGIDFRF